MNILFLVPYPLKESPSQRFRFEQYFNILSKNGYSFRVHSFLESGNWQLFFQKGKTILKILALLRGFLRRTTILLSISKYDFIFIHREASPLGPPVFEWIINKIFRKKIIFDFDDAIWLTDRPSESIGLRILKWRSKVKRICQWSYKISCGNDYLCRYARQFNQRVVYNPTTIDTDALHNPSLYSKQGSDESVTIGWTGSHSTLKYLKQIEEVLKDIEKRFPLIRILIIADRKPDLELKSLVFKQWSLKTEIEDLCDVDIGIMPLPDDDWSKGKCGFKALQFMALEIPVIASPVGVNKLIIDHGINGFLATSQEEWRNYSIELITHKLQRKQLGKAGRSKIIDHYSVRSNYETFLALFE